MKKILVVLLVIVAVSLAGYFVAMKITKVPPNELQAGQYHDINDEARKIISEEFGKSLSDFTQPTMKTFQNEYFSFQYPSTWSIETPKFTALTDRGVETVQNTFSDFFIKLSSPKLNFPVYLSGKKTQVAVPLYEMSFIVYTPAQFAATDYRFTGDRKTKMIQSITDGDLAAFANSYFGEEGYIQSLVSLNGKMGLLSLNYPSGIANDDSPLIPLGNNMSATLYFPYEGKVMAIRMLSRDQYYSRDSGTFNFIMNDIRLSGVVKTINILSSKISALTTNSN